MSPFEMNYGMNPTAPSTIGMPKKCSSASEFLANLQANLEIAKAKIQQAADRAKESTSLSTGKCSKLSPRYCGPWKIVKKLSNVAYRLELPPDCKVHPVFHVSKLRKYISMKDNLIEGILRNHVIQEYLVPWRGLPLTDSAWESEALVRNYFPSLIIEDNDL
ncbi:hypothetical protein KP509_13G024100 [Ceratopteris richardii]|uniref:Chromo domain-containing protein n=1 Tax=Ceratopteris richardii TaxID=49495 RepID=A0A8T2TE41_CERRI|nr:hypothetical protein KP509_13G024100 [Ceratopteris richardii]